ncbi:dicarboxylate/amino acid:cation symporter [Alkalicella caledoniensis]|uniref:Dicarboxylate/amino acid:cation symporter n=2 Tax=Alkalicella caledoniensis TaxID=2731377 RepID=A0A7G9WD62_ALKCA|nr:dicarboxylate/amino acid:cation symporter [Alkalicella caledoniensis]
MSSEKISKKSVFKNYKSLILLVLGIVVGCIVGLIYKEKAVVLKPFGQLFLNMMFTAVVPLVFFSLSSSIAKMTNMKRLGKILRHSLMVFVITGIIASVFIIMVVSVFPPAQGVEIDFGGYEEPAKMNILDQVVSAISVNDFNLILSKGAMLPLIIFSITLGYCIRFVSKGNENNSVVSFLDIMAEAFMKMIRIIMLYAPIGLGAYFAALIGEFGSQLLGAYSRAVIMFYPICVAYFLTAFTLYVYFAGGIKGVKVFYKNIFPSVVTSLATQSSIATLPTNLAATKRMNVKDDISNIILPMGATIHMDGTALTSLMKIAFLFGIFGLEFSGIGVWSTAILISVMSGVILSGIPGGGMMGCIMIVSFYGFNPEVLPIVVTIGLLTDAVATMINSTGDVVVSMMVSRTVDGRHWMEKTDGNKEEILGSSAEVSLN